MTRMYDLRQKEVINTKDGIRYGFVSDLELDVNDGRILAIIIPGPGRVLGVFGRDQEYRIPWSMISKIGEDLIIVDCDTERIITETAE